MRPVHRAYLKPAASKRRIPYVVQNTTLNPMLYRSLLFGCCLLAMGCDSDETAETTPTEPGKMTLSFSNQFDGTAIALGSEYSDADGSPISFSMVRYWISNLTLTGADGQYAVPDSYYLVEQTDAKTRLSIDVSNVKPGDYTSITFGVGVDEARNHSLDNFVGELEAGIDMDWSWSAGFIFHKIEGDYLNVGSGAMAPFQTHIGTDDNYKSVTIDFGGTITVSESGTAAVEIIADMTQYANGLDFNTVDNITFDAPAPDVANIVAAWWSLGSAAP